MISKILIVTGVLVTAGSSPSHAQFLTFVPQPVAVVDTGTRVRLQVAKSSASSRFGTQRLKGRIQRLERDTLHLQISDSLVPVAIPRTRIRRLETSIGSPSRSANVLEGALLGAGVMAMNMWFTHQGERVKRYEHEWQAVVAGAGMGMLMGGYLKFRWPLPEHWRAARLAR